MVEILEYDPIPEDEDETFIYGSDDAISNLGLIGYDVIQLPNGKYVPCGIHTRFASQQEFLTESEAWDRCLTDHEEHHAHISKWYMY